MLKYAVEAENATEGIGGVFRATDGNGVHIGLDDRVIVATRLCHVAKEENVFFFHSEFK